MDVGGQRDSMCLRLAERLPGFTIEKAEWSSWQGSRHTAPSVHPLSVYPLSTGDHDRYIIPCVGADTCSQPCFLHR
jgi:hypothetical protein